MSTNLIQVAVLVFSVLFVTGCTTTTGDLLGGADNWGEANRQTFAQQIVDPEPEYPTAVPVSSGDQASKAIDRYRTDTVKQPETQKVSEVAGGSRR